MTRATPMRAAAIVLLLMMAAAPGFSGEDAEEQEEEKEQSLTDCTMKFSLKGWSAFYKTAKGEGTITCENGESAEVTLKATGGGITFGKSEIVDGTGRFTESRGIDELLGSYVQSEAHAGAGKSADAQALTKGEISLSLVGTGRGVDVGFAFGKFTIKRK